MIKPELGKTMFLPMLLFSGQREKPTLVGMNLKPFTITKITPVAGIPDADAYQVELKSPSPEKMPSIFLGSREHAPFMDYQAAFENQVWLFVDKKKSSNPPQSTPSN